MWSYDFVFDHCASGQQLKCLTVTDEFTKEGLAIDVDGRIRSPRVIEVLSRLVSERGAPAFLCSDNVLRQEPCRFGEQATGLHSLTLKTNHWPRSDVRHRWLPERSLTA